MTHTPTRTFGLACLLSSILLSGTAVAGGIDLLGSAPLEGPAPVWKCFLEDASTPASDVWQMRDGVLVCRGTPRGYIYTTKDYTNFVLELDWRWPKDKEPGRGGVLVRMTGPHKIWPKSLEAQINAPDAGDFWGLDGYQLQGPADRRKQLEHPQFGTLTNVKKAAAAEKPAGAWNHYKIVAEGGKVTLEINGQEVNAATDCDVVAGPICITSEGNEIHFRNVRLEPLP